MSPAEQAALEILRGIGVDDTRARKAVTNTCRHCGRPYTQHVDRDCGQFRFATKEST